MTPAGEITSDEIVEPGVTPVDRDGQHCAVTREGYRPPGIFLHTGWRSGGTWVWSRLRALETVTAFYEPLSTLLGDLTLADISAVRPTSNSGHPPLDAPYYEEYRSFLQERTRGVIGYQKRFGIDRFADVPEDGFPAMQAYLQNL